MNLKNLTFDKINSEIENFSINKNDSYIITYAEFIRYFENFHGKIEIHHLIISSHFVYGWMPTVLELQTELIPEILPYLNAAKSGHIFNLEEILTIKNCINNSLVGISKLLHFINPHNYAIWDSRIFRYLTDNKSNYGIDKPSLYLEYLSGMKEIARHPNYSQFHKKVQSQFNYSITPMRAIEIVMFEADRRTQKAMKL